MLYNKDIVELSLKEFGICATFTFLEHSKMLYLIELRKIFTPLIILIVIILIVCWVWYKVFHILISKVYTTIYIYTHNGAAIRCTIYGMGRYVYLKC